MIPASRSNFARKIAKRIARVQLEGRTEEVAASVERARLVEVSTETAIKQTQVTGHEQYKMILRRIMKAERDERMSITNALTPVRTYMGGFTRPRDVPATRWFPGGALARTRQYESPPDAAYEPHTVFLLESRYPIKFGVGRINCVDHIVAICREGDFPYVLSYLNSIRSPRETRQSMDNACWPWVKAKLICPRTIWWNKGEDPDEIHLRSIEESTDFADEIMDGSKDESSGSSKGEKQAKVTTELLSADVPGTQAQQRRAFHTSARVRAADDDSSSSVRARSANIPTTSWSRPPKQPQDADDNVVPVFYVERKRQRDDISERKEAEGSLMAELNAGILGEGLAASVRPREEKIPVEVRFADGTIAHPSGFEPPTPETDFHPVAAKLPTENDPESTLFTVKQMWDAREFVNEHGAPPIDIDAAVEAEYVKRKVKEIIDNGAAPPTNNTGSVMFDPVSGARSASTPESRSTTPARSTAPSNDPDATVPAYYVERKRQRDSISQCKEEEGDLMYELSAGVLSDGIAAEMKVREEKIPVEVFEGDGTVRHPSGFEPPTPETDFHPTAAKSPEAPPKTLWTEITAFKNVRRFHSSSNVRAHVADAFRPGSPALGAAPPTPESAHARDVTTSAYEEDDAEREADEDDEEELDVFGNPITKQSPPHEQLDTARREQREKYMPTLEKEPFWLPLMSVTLSTRPLALSYARLVRGLSRGTPFHAAIVNEDRKCLASFPTRMRQLRLRRMRSLAIELGELLQGQRGGLPGMRTSSEQLGRGVFGEGLADPIPLEKRIIKVGIGEWYKYHDDAIDVMRDDVREAGIEDQFEFFGLDEHGARTDGKSWPPRPPKYPESISFEEWAEDNKYYRPGMTRQQRMDATRVLQKGHLLELAHRRAARNKNVMIPPGSIEGRNDLPDLREDE